MLGSLKEFGGIIKILLDEVIFEWILKVDCEFVGWIIGGRVFRADCIVYVKV